MSNSKCNTNVLIPQTHGTTSSGATYNIVSGNAAIDVRTYRAIILWRGGAVSQWSDGFYQVRSQRSDRSYDVSVASSPIGRTCDCGDATKGNWCKHIRAAEVEEAYRLTAGMDADALVALRCAAYHDHSFNPMVVAVDERLNPPVMYESLEAIVAAMQTLTQVDYQIYQGRSDVFDFKIRPRQNRRRHPTVTVAGHFDSGYFIVTAHQWSYPDLPDREIARAVAHEPYRQMRQAQDHAAGSRRMAAILAATGDIDATAAEIVAGDVESARAAMATYQDARAADAQQAIDELFGGRSTSPR